MHPRDKNKKTKEVGESSGTDWGKGTAEEKFAALDAAGVITVWSPAEMGSAMKARLGS